MVRTSPYVLIHSGGPANYFEYTWQNYLNMQKKIWSNFLIFKDIQLQNFQGRKPSIIWKIDDFILTYNLFTTSEPPKYSNSNSPNLCFDLFNAIWDALEKNLRLGFRKGFVIPERLIKQKNHNKFGEFEFKYFGGSDVLNKLLVYFSTSLWWSYYYVVRQSKIWLCSEMRPFWLGNTQLLCFSSLHWETTEFINLQIEQS